jgi:hypothetical protein
VSVRRLAPTAALPGIPLVLLLGSLISPTDSTDNSTQLRAAAAHAARWDAAAFFELTGALLFPLAAVACTRVLPERGRAAATVGAALAGLGSIGLASIGLRHLFIYGLATAPQATALNVLSRVDHVAGAAIVPCMFAGPIALIVLTFAVARAGLASRLAIAGAVLFFISDSLPIPAAEEIQGVIGIATLGYVALRLVTVHREPAAQGRHAGRLAAAA